MNNASLDSAEHGIWRVCTNIGTTAGAGGEHCALD